MLFEQILSRTALDFSPKLFDYLIFGIYRKYAINMN
jgi:hypothetical protein